MEVFMYSLPYEKNEIHPIARISLPANIARKLQGLRRQAKLIKVLEQLSPSDIPGYRGCLSIQEGEDCQEYIISYIAQEAFRRNKEDSEAVEYISKLVDEYDPSKELVAFITFADKSTTIDRLPWKANTV